MRIDSRVFMPDDLMIKNDRQAWHSPGACPLPIPS
jgi:hypothetical protein